MLTSNGTLPEKSNGSNSLHWLNTTLGCVGLVGIAGNFLVCVVFLKIRKLRTLTNYLIVHQAVIDLITSLLIVPYYLGPQVIYTSDTLGGEIFCRVWKSAYLIWTCFLASALNLVVITLERYCAIVYPFYHEFMFTDRRVIAMLITEWIIAAAFKSFNVYVQNFDHGHCKPGKAWRSPEFGRFVGISNVFAQYLVPLLVMSVAYSRCIYILITKKSGADVTTSEDQTRENSMKRASQNVLKMLILVFLAYAICWGPPQITFLVFCFGVKIDFGGLFYNAGVVLGFVNTAINPFIYALKYKQFQKGLKHVFCSRWTNTVEDSFGLDQSSSRQA
ncbi:neuromedin-U receptor 2-like [Glandiceps talaboti]